MDEKEKHAWSELEHTWQIIRNDRTRGAAELLLNALQALRVFLDAVESPDYGDIDSIMNELAGLRSDMAGFSNSVRLINTENIDSLRRSVTYLQEYLEQASAKIADNAAHIFTKRISVMTNSRSSIVEHVIRALHRLNRVKQVIQTESRPSFEGRYNAERLIECGVNVTVIPDAAMGYWIDQADAVLIGADAIDSGGSFIGKIGSYPLALLARSLEIPYYVAADRLKFVHDLPDVSKANINFSGEAVEWGVTSDLLAFSNIIFERTDGDLVTGYITEYGLQKPPLAILDTLSF